MSAARPKNKSAIAVVGMSGRFPGARNLAEFWNNLRAGVESLTGFSDAELLANGVDPAQLANPAYVKAGSPLEQAEVFDAAFFGVSPREASIMDPQHRVFLECAWEAVEDAGYDAGRLTSPVGVFAGASMNTYVLSNLLANPEVLASAGFYQAMIGNDKDFLATRVSYKLNLRGPSLTVQTACSTSLVAVHMARESLLTHQCDMALAGGISLSFPQRSGYLYQEGMIFSPDGHVRPFDAEGGGIRGGAGVGVVVLKRLEDALADGDTIRAVILASAINNDGAQKIGYTAPSVDGQAEAIATAQSLAEVDPATIGYIEAHGTATPLGDPIEIAALTKAFGPGVGRQFCAIGSVKSNIGHLDAAAGVAGLIKTVLSLQHRELPPSLNFNSPNPQIDFAASPFYVNSQLRSWTGAAGPRRAGVSSFGIGGTNAHAVLEEAPPPTAEAPSPRDELLVLSARSSAALEAASTRLVDFLESHPDADISHVAYTLQTGRKVFEHRRVVMARDARGVKEALTSDRRRALSARREGSHRNVAFMFSGQGSQHVGMGANLYATEAVFRQNMDACAEGLRKYIGIDLRAVLYPEFAARQGSSAPDSARINETALAQPALFAIEYCLARLWIHRGVTPQVMLGHSIGEYAAACVAGVFSLDSALEIVAIRGASMQKMPPGAMLAVPLGEAEVAPYLGDRVTVAAINAPGMCVLSGPIAALDTLERELESAGLSGRRLRTSHAFHSAMMEPAVAPFVAAVARHELAAPRIPFVSNVTGTWITDSEAVDPAYWGRHLRAPVRFAEGVRALAADPGRLLLEVGPGATLKTLARQTLAGTPDDAILTSLPPAGERTPDDEFMLMALGRAWLAGAPVRWEALHEGRTPRRISLPTYPFEGQRCWVEPVPREQLTAKAPTPVHRAADLSDWFWLPSWQRSCALDSLSASESVTSARWLVFADSSPACVALLRELAGRGVSLVTVYADASFSATSAGGYRISPDSREDYSRLLQAASRTDAPFTCVAHFWNTGPADAGRGDVGRGRRLGFYSLLFLAQALDELGGKTPLPVLIVTTDMQSVLGHEPSDPSRALALGPALVMSQDVPFLRAQVIDLTSAEWNPAGAEVLATALLAESTGNPTQTLVAYRNGFRWVAAVSAQRLEPPENTVMPFRERGVYLITGGLSGIGLAIATYLATTVHARLVLVSRSASDKNGDVQALEALGAEVLVAAADVSDEAALSRVLEAGRARFGALNGVIHAAGLPGVGLLQMKTREMTEAVLRPKVEGTLVLDRLLSGAELDFLVLCSSINSIIGWQGTTDYTSANAFQDVFSRAGVARCTKRVVAINWGPWGQTGMAARNAVATGTAGEDTFVRSAIGTADAMEALRRVLLSRQTQIFVTPLPMPDLIGGVEILTRRLQNQFQNDGESPGTAFGGTSSEATHGAATEPAAAHASGQPGKRPELNTEYVAAATAREQTLCAIWEELLGVQPVGTHDNFFELGGHSLLATRVLARVQGAFGVRLTLRDVFDAPTVHLIAGRIETNAAAPLAAGAATEEREEIEF